MFYEHVSHSSMPAQKIKEEDRDISVQRTREINKKVPWPHTATGGDHLVFASDDPLR